MTLDNLANALRLIQKYELDQFDVMLMDTVAQSTSGPDAGSVMRVIADCTVASRGKLHARIKRLCAQGLLRKIEHPNGNMRFKRLEFGSEYLKLMADLRSV